MADPERPLTNGISYQHAWLADVLACDRRPPAKAYDIAFATFAANLDVFKSYVAFLKSADTARAS